MEEKRNFFFAKEKYPVFELSFCFDSVIVSFLLNHSYRDSVANKARNLNFMTAD